MNILYRFFTMRNTREKILSILMLFALVTNNLLYPINYVTAQNFGDVDFIETGIGEANTDEEDSEDENIENSEIWETVEWSTWGIKGLTWEVSEIGSWELENLMEETVEWTTWDIKGLTWKISEIGSWELENLMEETVELTTWGVEELTWEIVESTGTGKETIIEEIKYNEEPIIWEKTYNDVTVRVEALSQNEQN